MTARDKEKLLFPSDSGEMFALPWTYVQLRLLLEQADLRLEETQQSG